MSLEDHSVALNLEKGLQAYNRLNGKIWMEIRIDEDEVCTLLRILLFIFGLRIFLTYKSIVKFELPRVSTLQGHHHFQEYGYLFILSKSVNSYICILLSCCKVTSNYLVFYLCPVNLLSNKLFNSSINFGFMMLMSGICDDFEFYFNVFILSSGSPPYVWETGL